MTVREDQVTAVGVEVDLTTLQSDQGWRDQTLRLEGLQSNQYPTARFTLTEPLDLPDTIQDRERAAVNAAGDLTLHGTTKQVAVDLEVELTGDRAVVVGSSSISLADFGIEVPTSVRVLSVADEGAFEFQIFFSRT